MNQLPQLLLKMVILAIFGTSMHDHELSADSFECFVYLRLGSSSCVVWESKFWGSRSSFNEGKLPCFSSPCVCPSWHGRQCFDVFPISISRASSSLGKHSAGWHWSWGRTNWIGERWEEHLFVGHLAIQWRNSRRVILDILCLVLRLVVWWRNWIGKI